MPSTCGGAKYLDCINRDYACIFCCSQNQSVKAFTFSFQTDLRLVSRRTILVDTASSPINLYAEISGLDYPFGELNLVNDPLRPLYGQAPSSLIYLGWGVFRGEGFLAPIVLNPTRIAKFLKSVVAHEVGHQWWGTSRADSFRSGHANQSIGGDRSTGAHRGYGKVF